MVAAPHGVMSGHTLLQYASGKEQQYGDVGSSLYIVCSQDLPKSFASLFTITYNYRYRCVFSGTVPILQIDTCSDPPVWSVIIYVGIQTSRSSNLLVPRSICAQSQRPGAVSVFAVQFNHEGRAGKRRHWDSQEEHWRRTGRESTWTIEAFFPLLRWSSRHYGEVHLYGATRSKGAGAVPSKIYIFGMFNLFVFVCFVLDVGWYF